MRLACLLALTALLLTATSAQAEDAKPRVLILGDSISIAYTPYVQKILADGAVVLRPTKGKGAENCAGTNNGVANIDRWLEIDGGNWDVIHFNFGLHDLKHVDAKGQNSNNADDPHQADPERYAKQLREIVGKLKATGASLIFATTTPVPSGGVKPYRDVNDPQRYNAIAKEIMKENGVAVNDLYEFALPRLDRLQQPVNVHFNAKGSEALAEQVAEHVMAAIKQRQEAATK